MMPLNMFVNINRNRHIKSEKKMYQEGRKAVDCFFIQISFNTKANTF